MSDEEGEEILPENDSVFDNIDAEQALPNASCDSILDDSFSSIYCSTPSGKGEISPRLPTRSLVRRPLLGPSSPRPQALQSPGPASPRPATRSQARGASPSISSPRPTRRSETRAGSPEPSSPRPTTRSQTRGASPRISSPRPTSNQPRAGTQESASPRPTTRSQTRGASPSVSSPRPTTRSHSRAGTAEHASPRPATRSRTGGGSPSISSPHTTRSQSRAGTSAPTAPRENSGITPLPHRLPAAAPRFPSKLKCPLCPSLFVNDSTLATHKKRHALKRAFARAASREEFLSEMPVLSVQSLEKMLKDPLIGTAAVSVNKFAQVVLETMKNRDEFHIELFEYLCDQLYSIFKDQNSIFASSLQFAVLVGVNKLLNSSEFRDNLSGYVLGLAISEPPDSVGTLNLFLSNFFMQLSYKSIIYYLKKIHGFSVTREIRRKRSDDSVDSLTFLQLSYHIGGSIVSGYLYKGSKYKASPWKSFVAILRSKFLRVEAADNACADNVSEFTESRDRGGYKHISQEALDFFVVLFDLLMSLEGADGSLPQNVTDNNVLTDDTILFLWDTLVGSDLDEDSSMDFLERMANTCRNCVMKGIMNRKLNENLKKAYSSVSLRSRLAN